MTLTMFDSVSVESYPADTKYAAGYVDGNPNYVDYTAVHERFPHATMLSITVNAETIADVLDVENGDATINDVEPWWRMCFTHGVYAPCIYTSASNVSNVVFALRNYNRASFRIWFAHYTTQHICAPNTCGYPQVDGTQWLQGGPGLPQQYDESLLLDHFFAPAAQPVRPVLGGKMFLCRIPNTEPVYLVIGGVKIHVANDEDLKQLLPKCGSVLNLSAATINAIPDGA